MTTRGIIVWAIVIIVIIGGGFLYWQFGRAPVTPENTQQTDTTAQQQVAGQDVTAGTGIEAVPGSIVSVLYVGMLEDGTVFDSSEANGNQPLTFVLGSEGIIPGFQIGVNGMREGGVRRIAIPPEFGYGAQDVTDAEGNVLIPANSTLVFDINLVSVQSATETPAQDENEAATDAAMTEE